ncbi:retrotransposon protein, putative, ty1-copia subclass [Tanacetum coccineum]
MERPAKDDTCHHYKEVGHCKRNCPAYLAELIKKKKQVDTVSSSDVFIIELFSFPTTSWVYDTMYIVQFSRLVNMDLFNVFTDYGISISKNNVLYFNVVARNGIYEIDMHDLVPNVNSIYNVSNKRVKRNLDSTYLWHCHLAHINKKRIKQLQQDGLLKSTDDESFDKGTDVCDPLRHVSRQGASYFITFTDDYSRYGYVYLLKHKHEVFETFKVFKNEVENQLGKTIKAIRSDRGGDYISQEFKDYLKANGIVQELTPPYTPQHNGVSERRNHTLLDMVQSMMNLTTQHFILWDLSSRSSATCTLNISYQQRRIPKGNDGLPFLLPTWKQNCFCKEFSISIAAFYDYEIWQMDVKTAFLNGLSDEDIIWCNLKVLLTLIIPVREAAFILGIKIYRDRSKRLIRLSQNAYMDKILKRYKMDNSKRGHIPMQERLDLNKSQGAQTPKELNRMKNVPYASAVGSIMYAVRCTRPDVAFAQNITSWFQQNPGELHWTAVKNILKYLRNTKDMFLGESMVEIPRTELRHNTRYI